MLEARTIKNLDEINCLKMAAAIVDGVWYRVWENLKPGIKDTDLATVASTAGCEFGAENAIPGGWRTGPNTFDRAFHQSSRIIQVGDLVYGSLCGLTYMGYGTCTYRTFIVGRKPTDKENEWYKRVEDRISAIIEEIKPGKTTADAAKHFPPASSWGYKEEVEVLASEIGHGLGLGGGGSSGYDMPIINRLWSFKHPQVFEEGMTIAVESREGERRVGGVRLENMLVVTKDGAEIMDRFPRDEILTAPR
jgi:Xaa-Pro aminopeptidase